MSDEQHPAWDQIEPGALRWPVADRPPLTDSEIELSKAISLKRIADALTTLSGPLNSYGETIGECIQGQHERGLRGIPNP
jgi:hypothetical protein